MPVARRLRQLRRLRLLTTGQDDCRYTGQDDCRRPVDAYMDAKALTDFAPLAAEGVLIRLLTDSKYTARDALQAPAARWTRQYDRARPLEVRFTAPRLLHDRLIIVDGAQVWSLTQSLKDFAGRSPASVLRVDGDMARLKLEAYAEMWASAQPL